MADTPSFVARAEEDRSLDLLVYMENMEEENVRIFQVKELSYEKLTHL